MRITVRVTPGARREKFEKISDTAFAAAVKEPAQRNEANDRVRQLVAAHYRVPLSHVKFITGTRSPRKVFEVLR